MAHASAQVWIFAFLIIGGFACLLAKPTRKAGILMMAGGILFPVAQGFMSARGMKL